MDETKEQIIKPPFLLTVQMFIYMTLIVLCLWKTISDFPTYFYDGYYDMKAPLVVYAGTIDVFAYAYALMGIYRTLKRKPYGIAILKISLVYVLMQLFFRVSSFLSTHPIWWYAAMWGIVILGGIVFLAYLFHSKRLNDYIPKPERKFGMYGWFGILIYLAVFVLYGLHLGNYINKALDSQKAAIGDVKLGEYYTDGYVKFKPLADWKNDTIYQRDDKYLFEFSSPSHNKITIGAGLLECNTRLDYYAALQNLGVQPLITKLPVEEINYGTELLNTQTLYYSTYTNSSDSTNKYYRTYAVFVDDESYKVAYAILDDTIWREQYIAEELLLFSQSLTFRLENGAIMHQSVNDPKYTPNNQYDE